MKKLTIFIILITLLTSCQKDPSEKNQIVTCAIISPLKNAIIYNNVEINLTASVTQSVEKVEFYFDGVFIGSVISEPFTYKWTPENVDAGVHKIICIAIPKDGENAQSEIDIIVELKLGDNFKGGKIFFIDETGQHGLIAALNDITINSRNSFFWGSHDSIGAANIDNGKENTIKMADASSSSNYAGYIFKSEYELHGYIDWYIPAQEELKLLKENQDYVGEFPTQSNDAGYWSSTELSNDKAFALNFVALMGSNVTKGLFGYRIRPIREF